MGIVVSMEKPKTNEKRRALLALALLVPAPSLGTWAGLVGGQGEPWGQAVYAVAKGWILALPLLWLVVVERRRPRWPRPKREGMVWGAVTGVAIFAVIMGAYLLFAKRWIEPGFVSDQIAKVGLDTPLLYLLFAGYVCVINALLEEYVWRWFVATRCEALMRRAAAVVVSALFFTLHHVIALDLYFDWRVTALSSLGIFIGGATWSWLYIRYRNIYAAYLSHIFADIAIFVIGYWLAFGGPGA